MPISQTSIPISQVKNGSATILRFHFIRGIVVVVGLAMVATLIRNFVHLAPAPPESISSVEAIIEPSTFQTKPLSPAPTILEAQGSPVDDFDSGTSTEHTTLLPIPDLQR